jgi:hypothetical protein
MPHGPTWNRLNLLGQIVLAVAFTLLVLRVAGWVWPGSAADRLFRAGFEGYDWFVDLFLAGILGYGLYSWFSGRMWCRFACPLAALMHVCALLALPNPGGQEEVHLVQRVHERLPPGHRRDELRQQGPAHAGPRVRGLLGLCPELPDRRPVVRPGRAALRPGTQARPGLARCLAGTAEGAPGAPGLTTRVAAGPSTDGLSGASPSGATAAGSAKAPVAAEMDGRLKTRRDRIRT